MITTDKIVNVALIGHNGEGKTTLAEAMLFKARAIDRQGKIEDGNTVMDFDSEEISKKSSISLSVANLMYKDVKINLIDVPGFFDFEGEFVEAMSVADSAIIVTSASGSLTVGTEKAVDYCLKNKIPSIIYINAVDKENANFARTLNAIKAKYGNKIAPRIVPNIIDDKMIGFIRVAHGICRDWDRTEVPIPERLRKDYETAHQFLIEAAAENDEALLEKLFNGEEITGEEIIRGVKIGVKECSTVLLLGGSAYYNEGVYNLMDKILSSLPFANEAKPILAKTDNGEELVSIDPAKPTLVRVFKTIVDPYVGRLNIVKVIQGKLKIGQVLHNTTKGTQEKITSLFYIKGKKQEHTDEIVAGDIGAIAKLSSVTTSDTLCASENYQFESITMPKPVYSMAVYAKKKGDEDKIFAGLKRLQEEDISFKVKKSQYTNEMLLSGVGETQLNLLLKKLEHKFGVIAELREPKINYRETIRGKAEAEGKHKKQSGGAGQFGQCSVRFEPGAEDGVYEFVDAVVGGAVPRQFIPAVDKGLRESIAQGVLAGFPMVNLKCTLFDGKYHPVDSKEVAFVMAAKQSYQEGVKNAKPVILEPVMNMKITVPEQFLGDIMGDINKRRGRILATDNIEGLFVVTAEVPESEMLKYATDLRSITQGRGMFEATYERHEEVTLEQQQKIIDEHKKQG